MNITFRKYDVKGSPINFFGGSYKEEFDKLGVKITISEVSGLYNCFFTSGPPELIDKFEDWLFKKGHYHMKVIGVHDLEIYQVDELAGQLVQFKNVFSREIDIFREISM